MTEDRIIVLLWGVQHGYQQLAQAWQWAKTMLAAGHRLVLELRLENRSDAQNRLLHSRINDIRKHCTWGGKQWDTEDWKRLLTAAWCRAHNEGAEMVPAIDGRGFDVLYRRTSKLSRRECADLSEYIMAWGTEQGVPWCAASLGRDAQEPAPSSPPHAVTGQPKTTIDAETGEILEHA